MSYRSYVNQVKAMALDPANSKSAFDPLMKVHRQMRSTQAGYVGSACEKFMSAMDATSVDMSTVLYHRNQLLQEDDRGPIKRREEPEEDLLSDVVSGVAGFGLGLLASSLFGSDDDDNSGGSFGGGSSGGGGASGEW